MKRKLLFHDTHELALFKRTRAHVRPAEILLDVGAGIRPQQMIYCKQHLCAEPHDEYADLLAHHGYTVLRMTGVQALERWRGPLDTVVALDVLEHMERAEGERFVRLAVERAARQVVILTPLGFMPQDGGREGDLTVDPWGMQGQQWQKHRSGWRPEDFPGWTCEIDRNFNDGHGAFFAVHDAARH